MYDILCSVLKEFDLTKLQRIARLHQGRLDAFQLRALDFDKGFRADLEGHLYLLLSR